MYDYKTILIFIFLIVNPLMITKLISKKITYSETNNYRIIIKNIGLLILLLLAITLISIPFLQMYESASPNSTSNLCTNTGGWTYTCKGNNSLILYLIIIGILITIHHIISIKYIFIIFNNCKKIFSYIFMYIYMISLYIFNFWLLIFLYGLMSTIYFNNIINFIRLIVLVLPILLFYISIWFKKSSIK